jgi:hypothetical protein
VAQAPWCLKNAASKARSSIGARCNDEKSPAWKKIPSVADDPDKIPRISLGSIRVTLASRRLSGQAFGATILKCPHSPQLNGKSANHGSRVTISAPRIKQRAKKISRRIKAMAPAGGIS